MASDQQMVEIFHLLFIKALEKKIDKALYALKGGSNLRFFFKSIRYSEDIDFDVAIITKDTLQKHVNNILNSKFFLQILATQEIEIVHISEPKQTETTQRWKLGIRRINAKRVLSTKIEFSRRKMDEGSLFEPIDNLIIQTYQLQPILCKHYSRETALFQKINALINRSETQARDIFDIKWLSDKNPDMSIIKNEIMTHKFNISIAIENTLSLNYSEFKGHVVSFLLPEYQEYYGVEKVWNQMQMDVINILETFL